MGTHKFTLIRTRGMKLLASCILAAASVSAQTAGKKPLTAAQKDIQRRSQFNNWYHDLTDRQFINDNFAIQYDELIVQLDVFTGYKNDACVENNSVNAGCQFIKLLKREMSVLGPQTRYDEKLNDANNKNNNDLYCNAGDGECLGPFGGKTTKIFPSFAGNEEDYVRSMSLNKLQNAKGWNCIFPQAGPVSCLFIGDSDNCRKVHNAINGKNLNTQSCDQASAKEYCWRHGAELALPDFLTLKSVVEPLCSAENAQQVVGDNFSLSIEKYWLDAKKVIYNNNTHQGDINAVYSQQGQEYFNVLTNSKFNLFGKLDHKNRFIGIQKALDARWASGEFYSNDLISDFGRETDYELLIRSYSAADFELINNVTQYNNLWDTAADSTNPNRKASINEFTLSVDEYFSAGLADDNGDGPSRTALGRAFDTVYKSNAPQRLTQFASNIGGSYSALNYYKNLFAGNQTSIDSYKASRVSAVAEDVRFHGALMLDSVRSTFGKKQTAEAFLWNKNCMILECESSGTVEYQVESCNSVNIRPLCVMDSFISVEAVCPSEIGINFCGDNVRPFLMTTVYGNLAQQYQYDSNGVLSDTKSTFKLGQNGVSTISATAGLVDIRSKDDNIIAALNRYLQQKNVKNADGTVHQRALYMQCDTINAQVDGPAAIENGVYKADAIRSYNRKVCDAAGWVFNQATNKYDYDFTKATGIYATKFTTNTPCRCQACNSLTWANVAEGKRSYTRDQVNTQAAYVHANAQEITVAANELRTRASASVNVDQKTIDDVTTKYSSLKSQDSMNTLATTANVRNIEFHCCPAGQTFVSDTGYNYGNIALSQDSASRSLVAKTAQNSVEVDCGISYCSETSSSVTGLFWSKGVTNLPARVRVDLNGKQHTDNRVHGRCVPLQCLRPLCTSGKYDKQFDTVSQLYALEQGYASCRCPCDSSSAIYTCKAPTSYRGRVLYEPPKFRPGLCAGSSCRAPQAEANQRIIDPVTARTYATSAEITGNQVRAKCNTGYQLACKVQGNPACDVNTGLITCTRNSDSCVQPMVNPYQCNKIFCTNPCNRPEFDIEVNGTVTKTRYSVGERVDCKCKEGLIKSAGACLSTCEVNGVGQGIFVHQCSCGNDNCKLTCEIPNAIQYTRSVNMQNVEYTTANSFVRSAILTPSKQSPPVIALYNHVFMQCKSGFELRYSHNDEEVGKDQHDKCARQCYKDSDTLAAKLDHIACYCAPKKCPSYTAPATHENNDWRKNFNVYWPDTPTFPNKFSEVCSKCKGDSFSTKFGHRQDCVKCTTGKLSNQFAWTKEGKCVQEVCPDPRGVYGAQLNTAQRSASHSLNLRHTISSMDLFTLPNNQTKSSAGMTFGDHEEPIQPTNRLGFSLVDQYSVNGEEYLPFFKEDGANTISTTRNINAVEGTRATFTCMKGFSPYLNWPEALAAGNMGPLTRRSFDCVCKNGKWCCQAHCRCDGICAKPKCVGC